MIQRALESLPFRRGTKKEILYKISELYNIDLTKECSISNTLAQSLSKYFEKTP
jgi:hypothetical protein